MSNDWPEGYELASAAVKDCAESIAEERDVDKETAFAICQDMENKGQLTESDGRNAGVPDDAHRFLQANFRQLDVVRRVQEGDDVRYQNIVLIGEGEWTDAFGNTEFYSREALARIAENPEEFVDANHVDVNHEHRDQLLQVGHIDTDTLEEQDGLLTADIVIYGDKTAGKDIIADMDRALESDGQQGAGGFSVEIPEDGLRREFNSDRGMYELTQFKLAGGAIVTQGASGPANFDQQFAERAIAMGADDSSPVRVLQPGDNTLSEIRQVDGMETITELEQLHELGDEEAELLVPAGSDEPTHVLADGETVSIDIEGASIDDIRDALGGGDREMEGEAEVAAVIDEYLANEGSPDDGVDTFLDWVRSNTDADMDAIEALAADYLAQSDAEDLSETPVSEFMAFLDEQEGGGEEGGEGEEESDEEMQEMSEKVEALERKLSEKDETIDDLARRLETLEDEPAVPLNQGGDEEGESESKPVDTLSGIAQDGEYIGR